MFDTLYSLPYNTEMREIPQASGKPHTFTRRHLLGVSAATAGGLLVGCGDGPDKTPPTQPLAASPESAKLQPSSAEQLLWPNVAMFAISKDTQEIDAQQQMAVRIPQILDRMQVSQNPELKEANTTLTNLGNETSLFYKAILGDDGQKHPIMSVNALYDKEFKKTVFELSIDINTAAAMRPIDFALALTHEARHLHEMQAIAEIARKSGKKEEDVSSVVNNQMKSDCLGVEARGYGAELTAYVYETQLAPGYRNEEQEKRLAIFKQTGSNQNSSAWKDAVEANTQQCTR